MGIIRSGADVLDWTKEELKSIEMKTRKLMRVYIQEEMVLVCILQEKKEEEGL